MVSENRELLNLKEMDNRILIMLVLFVICIHPFSSQQAKAQSCGGGIFTIELCLSKIHKTHNITYKIYPVKEKKYEELASAWPEIETWINWNCGVILSKEQFNELADFANNTKLEKFLINMGQPKEGIIGNDDKIEFKTREGERFPLLINIKSGEDEFYLLGNLLGGCRRKTVISWKDEPVIIRRYDRTGELLH
jgi:hypothetical protein